MSNDNEHRIALAKISRALSDIATAIYWAAWMVFCSLMMSTCSKGTP